MSVSLFPVHVAKCLSIGAHPCEGLGTSPHKTSSPKLYKQTKERLRQVGWICWLRHNTDIIHGMCAVSVAKQRLPGEREVYVEARFGGLEVTLGDEHGDILSADMTGTCDV